MDFFDQKGDGTSIDYNAFARLCRYKEPEGLPQVQRLVPFVSICFSFVATLPIFSFRLHCHCYSCFPYFSLLSSFNFCVTILLYLLFFFYISPSFLTVSSTSPIVSAQVAPRARRPLGDAGLRPPGVRVYETLRHAQRTIGTRWVAFLSCSSRVLLVLFSCSCRFVWLPLRCA